MMNSFYIDFLSIYHGSSCIVQDLSLVLLKGHMMALMGPNGGGKTTLLHTLAGLHTTHSGAFGWKEKGVARPLLRKEIAYFPQHASIDHHFPVTVRQVVEIGIWAKKVLFDPISSKEKKEIDEALEKVVLSAYMHQPISILSGGQFQRMLFARMMMQEASLLLLDEPFSGVDEESIDILLHILKEWRSEGKTIVVAQHSRACVIEHFPSTLLLAQHFHRWGPTHDVVTSKNLAHAYDAVNLCAHS